MPKQSAPKRPSGGSIDAGRLDKVVAEARRAREDRERGYREQALKLYPWVCGRCGRSFTYANVQELTVHHRDHNHDNNPPDGSNWELLCLYCHDNEHSRYEDHLAGGGQALGESGKQETTHRPFEALQQLLKKRE
jgi:hypothetical protein